MADTPKGGSERITLHVVTNQKFIKEMGCTATINESSACSSREGTGRETAAQSPEGRRGCDTKEREALAGGIHDHGGSDDLGFSPSLSERVM